MSIPISPSDVGSSDSDPPKWVVIHPHALPGEICRVVVYHNSRLHSEARLTKVISSPSPLAIGVPVEEQTPLAVDPKYLRDESLIRCPHFMTCGGCQYQFLPYASQLSIKRDELVQAFTEFYSSRNSPWTPPVDKISSEVHASPLQYGYRTKLSPHFDAPPRAVLQHMGKVSYTRNGKRHEADKLAGDGHRDVVGWNPAGYSVPSTSTLMDGDDNRRVLEEMSKNKIGDDSFEKAHHIEEVDAMSVQDVGGAKLHTGPKPSWWRVGFTSARNHTLDIEARAWCCGHSTSGSL